MNKTTGVSYCSATNSTLFTDCCRCAANNEIKCPECKAIILPESDRSRHDVAMKRLYGTKRLAEMRSKYER